MSVVLLKMHVLLLKIDVLLSRYTADGYRAASNSLAFSIAESLGGF